MTSHTKQESNNRQPKRRYLSASERKQEILEAAFDEFSRHGFVATSLERIANRAGISKSGIYTHYNSKNDIFEDVLATVLLPEDHRVPDLDICSTLSLPQVLDRYLDKRYETLKSPKAIAAFRLLIAESGRTPKLVQETVQNLLKRCLSGDHNFIHACLKHKNLKSNITIDEYLLASTPAGLLLILHAVFGEQALPVAVAQIKALHKRLLLELLQSIA